MSADCCPVCLESLAVGSLGLSCGHAIHASCLLATFQDEPLGACWRCPCCRAVVDPAGVTHCAELPPEARGREFYRPQPDLEIGSAEAEAAPASSSPRAGPLVAVGRFMRAAGRALQEEAEAEAATADCCTAISPCRPPLHYSSWALHTAERVMPGPLAHAAAVALASLSVRQLLRPKGASGPSLGVAAALWVNAAALFAAGCAAGVLLLARFLISGIRLLCVANQLVAHMLGLASECSTSPGPVPRWILGAGCFSACCVVWEVGRSSRPRPWALLLRLERHAPRLLLQLYAVAFLLAANMLLLAFLFNTAATFTAWLSLSADPPGAAAAWAHVAPGSHP